MNKLKELPKFKNEQEERKFWLNNDSSEYLDWSKADVMKFTNIKPSTKSISIRLPQSLIDDLKMQANKLDVPYQSYMKILISDSVRERAENIYKA